MKGALIKFFKCSCSSPGSFRSCCSSSAGYCSWIGPGGWDFSSCSGSSGWDRLAFPEEGSGRDGREQQFVHQIIEQDEAQMSRLAEKDRSEARELQDRWKEAIEACVVLILRKKGNPLYVLPWYLVIGESASGKTTAIQSARLSSPFFE